MHYQKFFYTCIASLFLLNQTCVIAAECTSRSGANTVPLLELYSSEGCSSCPPADKWVSSMVASGFSTDKVVPLVFHVDYWDYLGWKDVFAKAAYSERQRRAAAIGSSAFVYTPQIMLNGVDYRGWQSSSRFEQSISEIQKSGAKADLGIDLATSEGKTIIHVSAQTIKPNSAKTWDAYIAVYENKLKSNVNAGENSGRELKHDYVVRELYGPYKLNDQGLLLQTVNLNQDWKNRDAGVVAFVQNRSNGEVVQALALKMCGS